MTQIIKDRAIVQDHWHIVEDGHLLAALAHAGPVPLAVSLATWRVEKHALARHTRPVGVWLTATDDAAELVPDLATLPLIAVRFDKFTDGRGYSTATLLRKRHGYTGELRAIGNVLRDQLQALERCGFNAFALAGHQSLDAALASFADFSHAYQRAVDTPARVGWRSGL